MIPFPHKREGKGGRDGVVSVEDPICIVQASRDPIGEESIEKEQIGIDRYIFFFKDSNTNRIINL